VLLLEPVVDTPTGARTHDVVVRVHQRRFGRDRLGVAVGAALGLGVERELELGEPILDEGPLGGMGDSGGSRGDGHGGLTKKKTEVGSWEWSRAR
jgi:hypothetical protein